MAALTLPKLLLSARPPRILVRGSIHDRDCTKNGRARQVPFRRAYNHLPDALSDWIRSERDPDHLWPGDELFLGNAGWRRERHQLTPMGISGFDKLCQRLSESTGVHVSPHMLRHTWATRLVDADVQPMHQMEAGGWSSVEMVRRYYTADDEEVLAVLAAAPA